MDLLLWRLINGVPFCQFVVNVYVPKDRVTNLHQGYGFVEFRSEEDADYVSLSWVKANSTFLLYTFNIHSI